MPQCIDLAWLRANPLPLSDAAVDKNERGRVLVVGGAEFVPGALRLTGEAALRAGAGKLQMATVRTAAMSLGVLVPEAAMIALPADDDGEISADAASLLEDRVQNSDALVLGPGMSVGERTSQLVARVLDVQHSNIVIVLDAAALTCARDLAPIIARHDGRVILTPHHGEMALLAGVDKEAVGTCPIDIACEVARKFNAVVILKAQESIIANPCGDVLVHKGGCPGLATGGSGDVLAGIIGGLSGRGAAPLVAVGWAAWSHGLAGQMLSQRYGKVGFLARELLPLIPRLLNRTN